LVDGGVAGVEVVVEAVFPGDRAGVSKLGDLGLADFGVGGEQHHLVTRLRLVGLVRTLTTGWIGLFSDWIGVLTGRRCATARSFY